MRETDTRWTSSRKGERKAVKGCEALRRRRGWTLYVVVAGPTNRGEQRRQHVLKGEG